MRESQPVTLSAEHLMMWRRGPCVYLWIRGTEVLYIGHTIDLLARITTSLTGSLHCDRLTRYRSSHAKTQSRHRTLNVILFMSAIQRSTSVDLVRR